MPRAPAPRQTPPALLLLLSQFASWDVLQGKHQRAGTVISEQLFARKLLTQQKCFLLLLFSVLQVPTAARASG